VAQDCGWQVTGTELISDCVRFLNDDLHIRCIHTDIADAEFPTASFDAVTMRQVLEHTHDPVQVMEKCQQWLRPGGLLFLLVPNERAIDLALLNWACSQTTGHHKHTTVCPPIHYWGFTQKALRLMLRRAGFTIRDIRGFWEGDAMFHPNIGWARPIRSRKDLQWNIQLMLKLSLLRPLGELTGRQSQLMVLARRS
jgi:2-polyprenyl-3-methyl-5-hydroxy-6-metoxy-1,4-benzoquinol methylase